VNLIAYKVDCAEIVHSNDINEFKVYTTCYYMHEIQSHGVSKRSDYCK